MRLGSDTLARLQSLRQVMIPSGGRKVRPFWFAHSGVQTVIVPACVRELGEEAFRGCWALERVILAWDSKLEKIGPNCFRDSGLRELSLAQRLREVCDGAFSGCARLRQVHLPGRLERLGAGAFSGSALESIEIPAGVAVLEREVFAGC